MQILTSNKYQMVLAAACLLPAVALTAEPNSDLSYSYVELDYINLDIDQPNENRPFRGDFNNGDGYGVSVSLLFSPRFFFYGDYTKTQADFSFTDNIGVHVPGNTDILRLNLGLGFIMPVTTNSDFVVSGGYSDIDYDRFRLGATSSFSLSDLEDDTSDGYTLDAKLRSQLSQSIETSIGARYTDLGALDGLSIIGNLLFEMSPNLGLNVAVDAGEDLVTWAAGVRYSF